MSRYYNESVNGRGNTVSIGGRGSAGQCHLRAWDVGVKVIPYNGAGCDQLEIYLTSGSHAAGPDIRLGTAMLTRNGYAFYPNDEGIAKARPIEPTDPSGNGPINREVR